MSLPIKNIANRQRFDVFAGGPNGANLLLIYTGIVVIDAGGVVWGVDNRLIQDNIEFMLGPHAITDPARGDNFNGSPLTFVNGTATVSLAHVTDQGDSDNLTWSVDTTEIDLVDIDPDTKFIKINVPIEFQGEATALLRISYVAFISAKDSTPNVQSLTLDPQRLVWGTADRWSDGTVSLSGPAPAGGAIIQLTTDQPNLLALPSSLSVPQGVTTANFTAYLVTNPLRPLGAHITASLGTGYRTASLTLDVKPA